jgi:hypothetical protein
MSIITATDFTEPHQLVDIDIDALKKSYSWLLNSTAANVPATSSIAQFFWTSADQLSHEYYSIECYQLFQSLLLFPFWLFHDNNFGNLRLEAQEIVDSLPEQFYTTATMDKPMSKISVDP